MACAAISDPSTSQSGLVLGQTESLRLFFISAAQDDNLSQELRNLAADLSSCDQVQYKSLRILWIRSDPLTRPDLIHLMAGSQIILIKPEPRKKSEELQSRLRFLEECAERKAYKELVKDVNASKEDSPEPFSSYKDQLGFGLHVVLIMATGYLVGHTAFRALFNHNPAMSAAGGILGLVVGMLVETSLFIIRTSINKSTPTPAISASKKND